MANEISGSLSLTATKNGASVSASASIPAAYTTMSGDQMISNVQIIGTSSEAITLGDVSTIGLVFLKNLDSTNFVTISVLATAVATTGFTKLLAGGWCCFPAYSTQITAIADTAPVNLQVIA